MDCFLNILMGFITRTPTREKEKGRCRGVGALYIYPHSYKVAVKIRHELSLF